VLAYCFVTTESFGRGDSPPMITASGSLSTSRRRIRIISRTARHPARVNCKEGRCRQFGSFCREAPPTQIVAAAAEQDVPSCRPRGFATQHAA
jgi:hypothetical protein